MARNIIRLAGGTYERLKGLNKSDALKDREVVISKDTNELFVGKDDGKYALLSNVHIGQTRNDITLVDPVAGRFFFDEEKKELFIATGSGWKRIASSLSSSGGSVTVQPGGALEIDDISGDLKLKIDDKSIIINEDGNLAVGNQDLGVF